MLKIQQEVDLGHLWIPGRRTLPFLIPFSALLDKSEKLKNPNIKIQIPHMFGQTGCLLQPSWKREELSKEAELYPKFLKYVNET